MSKLSLRMTSGLSPYEESQTINLYLQTKINVNIQSRFIKILQLLKPYLPYYGFVSRLFLLLASRLVVTALTLTKVNFLFNCVYAFVLLWRTLMLLRLFLYQQTIVTV